MARLSDDAQRLATRGMVWVAALSLAVAGWLLWQHGDTALRLAGSELRGELAAGLESLHDGQAEMVRRGRLRQAVLDGPGSLAATIASADLAEYQKTHPAVTALWLLDESANVVVQQLGGAPAGSVPGLPARVHAMAQAAMLAAGLQTGWHQDAPHRQLLLAQPVRFNGSRQIDGALVSAVSIDALLQPLQAGLEPSMRADVLAAGEGGRESPRAGTRTATWPIQLRSAPQGHGHALTLQVSQPWWSTLWPMLWLAAAYALVGTLLAMLVQRRVLAQALQAMQPLQALRDAAAQVAEHGLVDIPEMSVQSLLDGGGEVQNLASSFADMLERLFKAQTVLEQTVASRTAELTLAKGRLDSTLAHLADGVYSLAPDRQTLLFASPPVQRLLGLDAGEPPMVRATMERLLDARGRAELERAYQQALEHGSAMARLTIERADGLRWLEDRMTAVRDADGQLLHFDGILSDVTERRAMLADLRLRNRAIDASHNGIVLVDVRNHDRQVVFTNEGFSRMTGYRREELIGRSLGFLQGAERNQAANQQIRAALESGEPCRVLMSNYRKDGRRFDNDLSIAPVHDEHTGEVTHYVGVSSDVTERLLAERLLRDQFARLDTIFALSPDGFVSFDRQGRVAAANPAFETLMGLGRSELIGLAGSDFDARMAERVAQLNPPGMAQWHHEHTATDGGDASTDVMVLHGPPQRVVVCARRDCDAPNVSRVLHLRDITRETEVDRMKSEFLSTAAHELRTPMASIRGFSDLLMLRKFDEERTRDLLQTINRQSIWLTDMVNELLDLARIEARKGKDFQLEVTQLRDAADAAVKSLLIPGDERRVRCLLVGDLPPVHVDRAKIQHALTNVLSNAYKYSPAGGEIELRLLQRPPPEGSSGGTAQVGIAVRDQGIGMAPEHAARAFERFFRADSSGSIPGTGLGLALVKEIIELHGGQVELHSELGVGTTVTMWLPAWDKETVDG